MLTTVGGVLLTGGQSRRMGTDKANLLVGGETLAARAARVLTAVCAPVVEVGDGVSSLPAVREVPSGGGPLAALVRGADALATLPVVLLACDMPFVEPALIEFFARYDGEGTVIARADGRLQFGCARYGADAIDAARAALARGERSYVRTFEPEDGDDDGISIEIVEPEVWQQVAAPNAFADVDTPDDLARLGLEERR
jgi:molybdopterin-guanine dinucleotide biosynthesis protein A